MVSRYSVKCVNKVLSLDREIDLFVKNFCFEIAVLAFAEILRLPPPTARP